MCIPPTSSLPNLPTTLPPPNPTLIPSSSPDTFKAPNESVLCNYFEAFEIPLREEYYSQELANTMPTASNFAYKKVANWVKPVATTLSEEYRIVCKLPHNPLTHPPNVSPGKRYTAKWAEMQKVNPTGFLTSEEEKLCHWIFRTHEDGFAWCKEEKGKFTSDYFDLVRIPIIEHILWFHKNYPYPSWHLWLSSQHNQVQNSFWSLQGVKLILPITMVLHAQKGWESLATHTWSSAVESSYNQGCISTTHPQNLCRIIW